MKSVYGWNLPNLYPVSAQVAGEYLETLREQNGGELTPEVVLEDSRDEKAVLHPCFEWDDSIAAEKFRLNQARHIICNITVRIQKTDDEPPTSTRALVSIMPIRQKAKYVPISVAMNNELHKEQVLKNAISELKETLNKYKTLSELAEVRKAVDDVEMSLK